MMWLLPLILSSISFKRVKNADICWRVKFCSFANLHNIIVKVKLSKEWSYQLKPQSVAHWYYKLSSVCHLSVIINWINSFITNNHLSSNLSAMMWTKPEKKKKTTIIWWVGSFNPSTPKNCLLILPSSYFKFLCKLLTRIWC